MQNTETILHQNQYHIQNPSERIQKLVNKCNEQATKIRKLSSQNQSLVNENSTLNNQLTRLNEEIKEIKNKFQTQKTLKEFYQKQLLELQQVLKDKHCQIINATQNIQTEKLQEISKLIEAYQNQISEKIFNGKLKLQISHLKLTHSTAIDDKLMQLGHKKQVRKFKFNLIPAEKDIPHKQNEDNPQKQNQIMQNYKKQKSLQQLSMIPEHDNRSTIYQELTIQQFAQEMNKMDEKIKFIEKIPETNVKHLNKSFLKNILLAFDKKITEANIQKYKQKIKEFQQKDISLSLELKAPQQLVKDYKLRNFKVEYFQNDAEHVSQMKQQFTLDFTLKSYSFRLDLQKKQKFQIGRFFQYNWMNLQSLKIIRCMMNNQIWRYFCCYAQKLLPNLKALNIQKNEITQVKQNDLKKFKEISRIWFSQFQGRSKLDQESKNQVKKFIQNKQKIGVSIKIIC